MKDPKQLVEEWLKRADDDLAYAQVGFEETKLYANVCFSCQQAFEKYLKAILMAKHIEVPKTHDLTRLLGLCIKLDSTFTQFEEGASTITPYNIATRYPDTGDLVFSHKQAKQALEFTKHLQVFIRENWGKK